MNKTTDLHIHTLVSDGNATPLEMLTAAHEAGVDRLSFCDHDALGAYRHFGDVFARAKERAIELIPGIELDTDFQDREVHLLGYGFDLDDGPLNKHLDSTQKLRKERVTLQIAIINRFFGGQVIDLEQILFPRGSPKGTDSTDHPPILADLVGLCCPSGTDKSDPPEMVDNLCCPRGTDKSDSSHAGMNDLCCRDTLMKPHLLHAMLDQGLFSTYRAAAYWLSQNAQVPVVVPKLPLDFAISLLRNAGGEAVLAHPGYLVCEMEIPLESFLAEFVPLGLSGLEVEYPYVGTSPAFPDLESERQLIEALHSLAVQFKLRETRGSDAHTVEALKAFTQNHPE